MPTLQRYKKLYQARIPSVGKGRKQRYPAHSLAVFEEIKVENIGKRGRPRKDASAAKPARKAAKATTRKPASGRRPKASTRKAKAAASAPSTGLLTLTEISRRTGISYPTLTRYVKKYGSQLKSEGVGRARRFYEEAVDVFNTLRSSSRRGGGRKKAAAPKKATTRGRKAAAAASTSTPDTAVLVARVTALEKQLNALERKLKKPIRLHVLDR
jgi:hypothetical protein